MTVYLDLIFFINFFYDFLLLLTVSVVLKRSVKIYKHFISSFVGALSVFLLLININSLLLFILKITISIIMCLISFKYISLKYTFNNILYLYMCSIILAGFLYLLNMNISFKHIGLIFINKGYSVNYIFLLIIAPVILLIYYKSSKKLKNTYNLYYNIKIVFDNTQINTISLFDSGNNLTDPVTKKPVIIVSPSLLKGIYNIRSPMYVSYKTINGSYLMKCYKPSYIIINNKKIYNYLIGESKISFNKEVKCLLNKKLMEDNYV